MAEGLILSTVSDAFRAAGLLKRALWVGAVLLAVAAAGAFLWVRQPEYRVLYASLSDRDGGAVVEALERLNIPYRLAESNGAIEVPADQLHAARYKLAAQGLPKGDQRETPPSGMTAFGLSPFQEQIGYQRALEDDLAKSVGALDGIASVRVHLALPRQTSFLRERIPPAASVLVKLHPSARLGEAQVDAIRHIVASSVPGMSATQVSVVDQTGALLAAGVAGLYRGLSPEQLEYTRRLESDYANRLADVLSPILQSQAYRVQVTAQVDFSESEETVEHARQSIRATQDSRRMTRHVREPKGTLRRLTALIVVDESTGLQRDQIDKLERLARQAIGYDVSRRDSVQLILIPFATAPAAGTEPAAKPESLRKVDEQPARRPATANANGPVYAGLALALLAGLLLIWVLFKRNRRNAGNATAATETAAETFETELDTIRRRVMEDPKVTASVVKVWMNG